MDKSELIDGQMRSMTGASESHMLITRNLSAIAHLQLRGSGCLSFASQMKVLATPSGMFAYPDLAIVCGEILYHDEEKDVLLNPAALFEVLSPSTESLDQADKFLRYRDIDILTDYILISQSEPRIEHNVLQENGLWLPALAVGLDAEITLSSAAVTIPLAEVYENVDFLSSAAR